MATPLYAPINVDIAESAGKVTVPWRNFFQALNNTMSPVSTAITQLTGDVTAGPGPGSVAATIANLAVTTGKVADDAITYAKMQNVSAASKLLGRGSAAGAGDVQEITISTGLTMSGTTLTAAGSGGTVTNTGTLTANNLILGNGGVDVKPLGSLGTTTTVYHGNAGGAGTFGAVSLTTDVSGVLPQANGGSGVSAFVPWLYTVTVLTNAQIKALPTTPITLISAPAANFQNRVFAVTLFAHFVSGAYTGADTSYATVQIETASGQWLQTPIVNDSSFTTPLSRVTTFFAAFDSFTYLAPYAEAIQSGGGSGDWGYLVPQVGGGIINDLTRIAMDNNGSGNLGGGHASNTLKVITYYVVESV